LFEFHWNSRPLVDMSFHWDALSWFRANRKAQTDFIQNTVNRDIKENSKRFWS
jgi:hypothetical protein